MNLDKKGNMNRKRGKRQKNDSGQEVLVLPPDLLQKLGINLEEICFNQDSSAVPIEDISGNEAPLLTEEVLVQDIISTDKKKESSIIETANLMKKSLFLSPTFNTPQSVVIPNSIEPGSTSCPKKIYIDNVEVDKNENSEIRNEYHCHAVDYCIENQHNIVTQYSQDNQSRSNPILNPSLSIANEESASQTKIDNKNKINILSEEIVNPTKLSTLRPLIDINDRKALVPIPIDTFISIDKHHQDNKITVNNTTCLSHNESKANNSNNLKTKYYEDAVNQTAQTNGEILENNTTETDIDMLPGCGEKSYDTINNLNVFKPAPNVENSGSIEDEDTLKETSNKIRSDQNKLKTVEEKANLEELKTCGASVNENELESAKSIANILFEHLNKEKNFFTSKQNKAKSKMSVQGVEKPGGGVQINQSRQHKTRTYARNKKNKIAERYTFDHVVDIDTKDLKIDYADNISYEHLQIPGQFCICFDFGYLDRDMGLGYAHPHFSNTENNIPLNDALSINIEDVAIINHIDCDDINLEGDNINQEDDKINHEETSDTDNICYNAVYLDSKIENEVSDSNNKLIQDNTKTPPKTKATLSKNEMRDVASNDNVAQSMEEQRKPAQVSPEVQTIQNMQQHGFDISNIDTEQNEENQDKLITKKRKLSLLEKEESKTDCQKRRKGRRFSRISNEKLEPVSRTNKHKVEVIEKQNSESIGGEESTHNIEVEQEVRCAMCDASVRADSWLSHAAGHAYIAWPHGQTPLDITDKKAIRKHLVDICDELGALTCSKCNTEKKSVKSYLEHTKHCKSANHTSNSPVDSITADGTTTDAANVVPRAVVEAADVKPCAVTDTTDIEPCAVTDAADVVKRVATDAANVVAGVVTDVADAVRCGVCDARLSRGDWMAHAGQEHNYRAWIHRQPQLDLKDDNAVYNHLYNISKEFDGLTCAKCGLRRKYVKAYLKHIESCKGADTLDTSVNDSLNQSTASLNCTVDEANTIIIHQGTVKRTRSSIDKSKSTVKKRKPSIDGNTVDKDNTPVDKDNTTVDKDNTTVDKENTTVDKDNTTVDKDNTTVDKENTTVDKDNTTVDKDNTTVDKDNTIDAGAVVCGVCGATVASATWSEHARTQHEYLAWTHGQTPLEISDEEAVLCHMKQMLKETGQLICGKCDKICKFAKTYLRHARKCGASDETLDSSANDTLNVSEQSASKTSNKGRSEAGAGSDGRDVACGVCAASVRGADWSEHARTQHGYLAWKDGETPLEISDEEAVLCHMKQMLKETGQLICGKCDKICKFAKTYLRHARKCGASDETLDSSANDTLNVSEQSASKTSNKGRSEAGAGSDGRDVTCGVCAACVRGADWSEHARTQHDYLAWKNGETPLEISDEEAFLCHLKQILKETGQLICGKCDKICKSAEMYLRHAKKCGASDETLDSSAYDTLNVSELSVSKTSNKGRSEAGAGSDGRDVTCGVCAASVRGADWSEHARTQHGYLAWKDGEAPLNVDDEEQVHTHLTRISRRRNGLTCNKCDKTMKYAKSYLSHVKACEIAKVADVLDVLECAVCSEKVEPNDWQKHAMSKHYNIAWAVGDTPVDIKNPFAAEKLLNKYKQKHNKLQCKVCGLVRVSCVGFYAHIIQCGKTDEEVEIYKSLCEICNNKYLCVYHSQHMKMHREQENAKQRKLLMAEKVVQQEQDTPVVTGRRKAAEKAINVINKSMGGEDAKDAASKTEDDPYSDAGTDSDESAQLDSESSESESGVDSDLSDQSGHSALQLRAQNRKRKKKKYPESHTSNIKRIPFVVKDVKAFLADGVAEIRKKVVCAGELYPQWRRCEVTGVPDARAPLYMPALKRSCSVNINANEWTTYELFEARVDKETSLFVGGCIQWISWAPAIVGDKGRGGNYLAVAAHREADAPRLDQSDVFEHPAMLQIWDFGDMTTAPKLSLCIALDCGTLWAGSWCPSGVRDAAAPRARLGLLAVATSSGAAYILSVPYPDDVQSDKLSLYKLKPVAELRFSRGERQKYQATSITWSTEKGHSVVVVGYADGSLGYYNVDSSSPLLSEQDDGVTIFYPYDEEYRHNSCITDVSTVSGGGVCSTSQTGSALRLRGAALRSLLPATCAAPLPLWPAALVVGNDILVNQTVNELECWGAGRRLGPLRCCGGCACCGAVAAVSPPALRLMRLHPAYGDHLKTDIATIQIARLDNKKPKIKNDDLAVVIEPRTYEDAIRIYGVQFKSLTAKHMGGLPSKEQSCERFPLADAVGVAFCPAPAHHTRLAVALHCGLVLLLNV